MTELFSLGRLYVSDFISEEPKTEPRDLTLILTDQGMVRLKELTPKEEMYGKYWYRSGVTYTMKNELKRIVHDINKVFKPEGDKVWIDIASNDGTLLRNLSNCTWLRIGIDPADDSFADQARKHADMIIQDYFTAEAYRNSRLGKLDAKVVTSIAMFYDLDNPVKFSKDVHQVLAEDGLWVIQLSYTPLMLKQLAFDNICHEHVHYYTLKNLEQIMNEAGFDIVDAQLNDINGGSIRLYMQKKTYDKSNFGSKPYRDVCSFRVKSYLGYEASLGVDSIDTWLKFYNDINALKEKTVSFIKDEAAKGKVIWGYGASTKGNTLLQYFGLDHTFITGIAERSKEKIGLKTIGTNIPIFSEEDMRKAKPDYLLILPWHFIEEFRDRESTYLRSGGKFIVPCPEFQIIGA